MFFFRQSNLYAFSVFIALSACKTASYQSVREPIAKPTVKNASALPATITGTPGEPATISSPLTPTVEAFPVLPADVKREDVEEKFIQTGKLGAADILVVIDNSDSMTQEQKNLSTKLQDLLGGVKESDWQIGVITTTVAVEKNLDKCVMTLIKPSDANFEDKFRKAVTPGVDGSAVEEGIRQAVNGLRCTEAPWVRLNSTVAVLIVSDEDNCSSNGSGCKKQPSSTEQYLITYMEQELGRVVGVNAGFFGIFSPPASPCSTALNKATQYQKLVDYKANGKVNYGKICDESYKETLQRISRNISMLLSHQFSLKHVPYEGTVVVTGKKADGSPITPSDYKIMGSLVTFVADNEPALKSEFMVTYKVRSQP
ncbi:MAG: VWA domain-containing protein [Oligoflexus sp.]|nr:VWA domain-containing protein [Oligoflexus sp.]